MCGVLVLCGVVVLDALLDYVVQGQCNDVWKVSRWVLGRSI